MDKSYNVAVLGGSSAIAIAYLKSLIEAKDSLGITLIGRSKNKLEAEAQNLTALGADVKVITHDLSQYDPKLFEKIGDMDELLLAYGILTEQEKAQQDQEYRDAQIMTNFVSATHWLEDAVDYFSDKGRGKIIVLGSVAGDRGRQSNYVYGASKAGLGAYVQGLQHRVGNLKDVNLLLVKPGFVDTPMNADVENKGMLWASSDKVGKDILKASSKNKRKVYTPWFWSGIMLIIRSVPSKIFEKTKL